MITLGLTGSIGMGKSATAAMFMEEGVPVYDADAEVHKLYAKGGQAVPIIEKLFPGTVVDGAVDRQKLSRVVLNDHEALSRLEKAVHPLVNQKQKRFFEQAREQGRKLVVLDIPLLFEKGGSERVDYVCVVSAPASMQRERVLQRPGMTAEKFEAILAKQVPDGEKRARADFVIMTDKTFDDTRRQVKEVIKQLVDKCNKHCPARK